MTNRLDELLEEAVAAVATTASSVEAMLESAHVERASLCHGLAGNAFVLLQCGDVLEDATSMALARGAADRLARLRPPDDSAGGECESPGLLLGWSGIGMFLAAADGVTDISPMLPSRRLAR